MLLFRITNRCRLPPKIFFNSSYEKSERTFTNDFLNSEHSSQAGGPHNLLLSWGDQEILVLQGCGLMKITGGLKAPHHEILVAQHLSLLYMEKN